MSMIDPNDYSRLPPDDDENFDEMQMRASWQPGWRPPSQSQCGPPWPGPGPGGGGWPFWGYWGFRLRSAWRDVKFLNKLIGDIIGEMIDNGIVAPGPNSPTQGPGGGTKGVTNGSDAGPGTVGEFVTASVLIPYAAYPQETTTTVSALVMSPGDWDIRAFMQFSTAIGNASFQLTPLPVGLSNGMFAAQEFSQGVELVNMLAPVARASISVPTLLAFQVYVNQSTNAILTAGSATLKLEARRMR